MGVITKSPTKERVFDVALESLQAMIQPGQVVELRILKVDGKKRTDSGYFDDLNAMAISAAKYNGRANVYITPNPVTPSLLARANNRVNDWVESGDTTGDLHIAHRHWLLIDADPDRPSGISSTDAEHDAALARIETICAYLAGRGWPDGIRADSGNGGHANYFIDLPNTPESTLLIQRCLLALSMQFTDDKVKIDTGNFNAARIWKLYGTKAVKGDHTDDRPHRYAKILCKPDELKPVTLEQLQALADLAPDAAKPQNNKQASAGTFNLETWMESNSITGTKAPWNGGQRWRLDKCYFSEAHTDGAFIVQHANGAIAAGCKHDTCQGKNWHDLRAIFDGTKEERAAKRRADDPMSRIIHDQASSTIDDSWPYVVRDKRINFVKEVTDKTTKEIETVYTPLADFEAKITGENTDEDGNRVFVISGEGVRGGKFSLEIAASDYGDGRKLAAALEAAVGAKDPIYVGCAGHMAPAIKKLTGGDLVRMRTYNRTGWAGKTFLMPGREPDGTKIILTRKLTYAIDHSAELAKGLEAIESLIQFTGPMTGTVLLSALFQAPLAAQADWRNERYALFIKGRTGTQKTATTQVAMCLYGPDFARDEMILKFGEGATRNALMSYAVSASDLPMLIDNYKPSTGGGARDFTNLIHNILEGGEKERLNRASQLKETKPIHTWPVCTGEDLPSNDPASLARILVVTFDAKNRGDISHLSNAQSLSKHLCAVGESWIAWLEGEEGRNIAKTVSASFATARESWAKYLIQTHPNMVNPYRVATNLATNQLTWIVLSQHPQIGPIAIKYMTDQKKGLTHLASEMAGFTAEALEANRFIASLKEMIAGGRAIVLDKTNQQINEESPNATRTIGWYADDGSAYLLPEATVEIVKKSTGDTLGNISRNALYEQLDQLGYIASKNKDRQTKLVRIAGDVQRILHLTKEAVSSEAEYQEPDESEV